MLGMSRLSGGRILPRGSPRKVGGGRYGEIIYNWNGSELRQGRSTYGTVLYNWDGRNIRQGAGRYGTVLYNWLCPIHHLPVYLSSFCFLPYFPRSIGQSERTFLP